MQELEKAYDHSQVEEKIYQQWLDSGYFNPDNLPDAGNREAFTISLPPPNATGVLHIGHAFEDSIQDTVIRFKRMQGKKTLWVPGTDHAAIATQAKFEKELYKSEGKSRHDFTRVEFFEMINTFALQNQSTILNQLHKLGLSLDWSRLAFTLDKERELAVRTAFQKMYEAGLIYRGFRMVNWDPKGQTTVSDDEIEYEEAKGILYTFKYSKDFPISIATTRPETKVGDTAVAVHPEDARYKHLIGNEYDLEFCGVPLHIKIIGDNEVDPAFGTGALGVTVLHSFVDWEIGQRHNLPQKQVINEYAKMTVGGTLLEGKKIQEARAIVAEWLKQNNLLEKEEAITQNIAHAQRTGGAIEPLPKLQWFIDVNKKFILPHSNLEGIASGAETSLKEIMRTVAASKQIEIMPERFEKTYFHWIDNLRDWCISRQIVYGHQIPVWYRGDVAYCGVEAPEGTDWQQDSDTLDTWFSSGLWTFSTLGWPHQTSDLKTFHPTSVMMPGYEILFFWVARMVLMSGFLLGDVPFKKVFLHGIVRDKQGRKFSKSLNNGIDPLEMTAKYGTDALRMSLLFGAAPGNDVVFDEQNVKGMKHFANKLWNIARFIMSNVETSNFEWQPQTDADKEILEKLTATIEAVTTRLETFQLHEAAQEIYQFTWHELADIYLEKSKEQLTNPDLADNTKKILLHNLIMVLKLLHPFMPFVTEHIWQLLEERKLLGKGGLLMVASWPK